MAPGIKCASCFKTIQDRKYLTCTTCNRMYDLSCASVLEQHSNTMTLEQKVSWICMLCINKINLKTTNIKTIVRHQVDNTILHGATTMRPQYNQNSRFSFTGDHLFKATVHNVTVELTDVQSLIVEIRQFHKEMRQNLRALNVTLMQLSSRIDICETRLDRLATQTGTLNRRSFEFPVVIQHKHCETIVQQLRNDLNNREQELLANDIEVTGIQEKSGENLHHIVVTLTNKLGIQLREDDLVSVTRIGSLTCTNLQRPRPIVVRLSRRSLRDQCLREARIRRGVTTEGTDIFGPARRFHVKERLTRVNRHLYRRARELAKHHNWRYAWTKKGKIYLRKNSEPDAVTYRIRVESDFLKIFGQSTVGTSC